MKSGRMSVMPKPWRAGCCVAGLMIAHYLDAFASPPPDDRYSAQQVITELARIPKQRRRVALVLSGGGAGGCYQAGVIKSLTEAIDEHNHRTGEDLWFDVVVGTSAGCLNGVPVARGPNTAKWLWKFPPQERAYYRGRQSVWDVVTPDRVMAMHSHKPYFPIDLQLYLFKYSKNNPRNVVWLLTVLLFMGLVYISLPAIVRMLSGDLSAVCFILGGVLATTLLTSLLTTGMMAGGFLLVGQFVLARGIHIAMPRDEFHPLLRLLVAPYIALIALASAGIVVLPWLVYHLAPDFTYWLTAYRRWGWWWTFILLALFWTPALWWWWGLATIHSLVRACADGAAFERRLQTFGGHSVGLVRWWLQRSGVSAKPATSGPAHRMLAPLGWWIDGATRVAGNRVEDLPGLYVVYRRYSTFARVLQRRVAQNIWAQRTVSVVFLAILFAISTATVMFVGASQQQGLFAARPLDRFLTEVLGRMVGVAVPARWEELESVAPEVGRKMLDGMRSDLVIATTDIVKRRADFFYRARPGNPLAQVKRDNWIALDNGNESLLIDAMKASASVFPLFPPVAIERDRKSVV